MVFPSALAPLLEIRTEDEEVRQKGELVQILILLLTAVASLQIILNFIKLLENGWELHTGITFLAEIIIVPLVCVATLHIVKNGRPTLAAHIVLISLNTILFLALLQADDPHSIPYLMLISVVAIATMASIKTSIVYAIVVIISVGGYFLIAKPSPNYMEDIVNYIIVTLSVSVTAWITASRMQKWLRQSSQLSQQMKKQTAQLQQRAQQLQRNVTISQSTSSLLNLDDLLKDIVYTLRDQYGFYFVAIYLVNQAETKLVLTETAGAIGEKMKNKRFQLDIDSKSIIGWVAQHQKARIADNVQEDPGYYRDPLLSETQSEAALPLIARGKLLGVLNVQSRDLNTFLEEDVNGLQIMANQLAVNVANARLFSQTESYLAETQTLLNLSKALATTLDVGEIYRRAARTFSKLLQADRTLIANWDQENDVTISQVLHLNTVDDSPEGEFNLNPFVFPLAHFPTISETLHQQSALIRYLDDASLSQPEQNFILEQKQASCLMAPLTHGTMAIGCVLVFRRASQQEFSQADMQLAHVMANETAVALHNATLTSDAQGRVAQLSALNRLSNRLSLAPTLHDIFTAAQREIFSLFEATTFSIMLLTKDEQHCQWIYGYEYGQELDLATVAPFPITQGFSGQVIRSRRRLFLNKDMKEKQAQYSSVTVGATTAAWLGVPLIVANKLIGVMVIENEHDADAFDERAIDLLETIAGSTAIALSNQLTLTEVQAALAAQSEQRLQLQTAAEVSAATNSILDLDSLLTGAVSLIKERFSLYYAGVFLNDVSSNQAVLRAATGEAGRIQLAKGHQLLIGGHSLIGGATGDGRSRISQDVTEDVEWQPNVHLPDTRSELALPLRVRGETIGALTVQSVEPHAFSSELVSILQTMSDQLAIAIDNSRLLTVAESRAQRQQVLNQISAQLHNTADTDEIIRIGMNALAQQANGRSVQLFLGKSFTPPGENAKATS